VIKLNEKREKSMNEKKKKSIQKAFPVVLAVLVIASLAIVSFGFFLLSREKKGEITFVQLTDLHLCEKSFAESYYGAGNINPSSIVKQAFMEIKEINPDFVVLTGDLVAAADDFPPEKAEEWFSLLQNHIAILEDEGITVYPLVGNHDVVGVSNPTIPPETDGYGKETFKHFFGLEETFYSFKQGNYLFLALDPNQIGEGGKGLEYRINPLQLDWIDSELSHIEGSSIVFLHEPTTCLSNRNEFFNVLNKHNVSAIFSGHAHEDTLLTSTFSSIPEQVTGALCGSWWKGPNKDDCPMGYRIVRLDNEGISSFYRELGEKTQLNLIFPTTSVFSPEESEVGVKVYSPDRIETVLCAWEGEKPEKMNLTNRGLWIEANAKISPPNSAKEYVPLLIIASGENETYTADFPFKVSDQKLQEIEEIRKNSEDIMGRYVETEGVVTAVFQDAGLMFISNLQSGMPVYYGDSLNPPKPAVGTVCRVEGKLVNYSGTLQIMLWDGNLSKPIGVHKLPEPLKVTPSEVGEPIEGNLIQLKNVKVSSVERKSFWVEGYSGKVEIYCGYLDSVPSWIIPGKKLDVVGICTQFNDHHRVCPRSYEDLA
jgi:predicted MPP superfamily phosphohydrolase